ncbi:UDP-N-acetylmuramoyl-tripeptide--D-alanyl-D-alanine ligase [Saccharopolyspora lacisalsi]|uniref:UDP-N-acetylmuramoyl-tripeptide--D-alanyl-D-alanine ligase n=1 Tax=Halosaccharopolyspora lacisalsi TaxID=1000566 RepID=A0A839DVT7_9PSEU|nr:UDP-N-acetylmuramoyl-tripeptide--D-alanyl-D-alanine ligase [Halosaccharopolyspora lacisalsi]MBA8823415.1 UDP-N-acetylmuramoyl-tripeptide--D-alanyl-D-alanine ligase [Halosaccharopolyspora lacisalsi]
MIRLRLDEIAAAVGGRLHRADGSETVTAGVEFDSRAIAPGGLFVAVPGERVDGHDFAARAVADGAAGVLAAREVDAPAVIVPPVPEEDRTSVMALAGDVDGSGAAVLAALAHLARHVVDRLLRLIVVGVTGSSGKTSTKDLIAQLLEPLGPTVAPPGSFNNELGHPWTVLRADEDTRHLVLELSARGVGHIAGLCEVAPPRIGAVLNVGTAHLGEFGSQNAVARAKGELVEALPAASEGGVAVLNADDPLVAAMAERTEARVVLVGQSPAAHVRAADVELDERARPNFTLITPESSVPVTLPLHGEHNVGNALIAAAIALELGTPTSRIAERLGGVRRVSQHRMEVSETADGVTVVNDAYNANPESMREALKTLVSMTRDRPGRAWAVLGVMGELGDTGEQAHDEIGRLAVRLNIDRLVVVGEQARRMHQAAELEGSFDGESVLVDDAEQALALLRSELRPGDVVLTKASNVGQLWRVAEGLVPADEQRDGGTE